MSKRILITGGAGFIGSHVVNYFTTKYPDYYFVVIDALTYASNLENIMDNDGDKVIWKDNMVFWKVNILDTKSVERIFKSYNISDVIHLAAESHVDNSIKEPNIFAETNILGTLNLLNIAKTYWGEGSRHRFYHISTDEVFGDLTLNENPFTELTRYNPNSPYSASKAASDHLVKAYGKTYNMNTVISNCSNNYGPFQHKEKLIPTIINKLIEGKKIPVYGDGKNIRDWIWVGDHVTAIDEIFHNGEYNQSYNIGGDNELSNIEIISRFCVAYETIKYGERPPEIDIPIEFVTDRKGHDFRYAVNSNKLQTNLNWKPKKDFEKGIVETINYYINSYKSKS